MFIKRSMFENEKKKQLKIKAFMNTEYFVYSKERKIKNFTQNTHNENSDLHQKPLHLTPTMWPNFSNYK